MGGSSVHATLAYNRDAVTTCGYVAQLHLVPRAQVRKQVGQAATILHAPANAFGSAVPFASAPFHLPLVSLPALGAASIMRSARTTTSAWHRDALSLCVQSIQRTEAPRAGWELHQHRQRVAHAKKNNGSVKSDHATVIMYKRIVYNTDYVKLR